MKFISSLLARMLSMFSPPLDLSALPASKGNVAAKKLAKARQIAAQRHGKPFHAQVIHPRETPPSRDLVEYHEKSKSAKIVVASRKIGKAK